jgi:protein-tyrosine phosphatase
MKGLTSHRYPWPALVLALAVLTLLTCNALVSAGTPDAGTGATADGGSTPAAEKLKPRNDIPGLPNFAKVSETLYRGGQPDERGFQRLKEMGIKTVVNLRSAHSDDEHLEGLGLNYARIKMDYLRPKDAEIAAFLKLVTSPRHQPVFVHCQHGSDRTGTMVAAYRMVVERWENHRAIEELPVFGFHEIWKSLLSYLEDFDPERVKAKVKEVRMPHIIKIE